MTKTNSKRLAHIFEAKTSPVLSPYLTAGFPTKDLTVGLMHEMVKAGCDIIELGIPFSEPMAEGVTIQQAMDVALENGTTLSDVLEMVSEFRKKDQQTAIILMGYTNPIELFGYEKFAQKAQKAGVDGTIIVDLPPEELTAIFPIWAAHELDPILLCSPTTSDARMKLIASHASGYVYYVSLKGVTGSQALNIDNVQSIYKQQKTQLNDLPLLVGFGIKTAKDAKGLAAFADGIVIGAALIETIKHAAEPLKACGEFLSPIASALKKTGNL